MSQYRKQVPRLLDSQDLLFGLPPADYLILLGSFGALMYLLDLWAVIILLPEYLLFRLARRDKPKKYWEHYFAHFFTAQTYSANAPDPQWRPYLAARDDER